MRINGTFPESLQFFGAQNNLFINITETPVIDLFLTLKIILNNPIVEIKRIGVVYPDTRVAYKTKLKEEMKIDEFIDIINDGITKEFSSEAGETNFSEFIKIEFNEDELTELAKTFGKSLTGLKKIIGIDKEMYAKEYIKILTSNKK